MSNSIFAKEYELQCMAFLLIGGDPNNIIKGEELSNDEITTMYNELSQITCKNDMYKSKFYEKYRKTYDNNIDRLSNKNKDMDGPPCPRCKSKMFSTSKQKRRCDEGMSYELNCPSCGYIKSQS